MGGQIADTDSQRSVVIIAGHVSMDPVTPSYNNPLVVSVDPPSTPMSGPEDRAAPGLQHTHIVRLDSGFASSSAVHPHRRTSPVRWVLSVIFRHWQIMLFVTTVVLGATAAAIIVLPPHYRSEAKLLVRLGRESVLIDPTASIGQSAVPMEGRDKEINSEIELLKGRQLLEAAVKAVGPNRLLSLSPARPDTPENFSKAITLVESKLAIEAIPESNILSIQFESRDPAVARDLIARLIESYLDARSAIYRGTGDLKFFHDQVAAAQQEKSDVDQQIQQLRDSTGISDPTAQRTSLLKQIDDLQQEIDKNKADRAADAASAGAVSASAGSADADHQKVILVARQAMQDSLIKSLTDQKNQAETKLRNVNEVDVRMTALQQQSTLGAARVTQYDKAYEQARIDQEMGQQRLSNISVAEPPTLPLTPKAPTRSLLALAGMFLALTLGLGSGFIADAMNDTVRTRDDLAELGLTQVVSIPKLRRERFGSYTIRTRPTDAHETGPGQPDNHSIRITSARDAAAHDAGKSSTQVVLTNGKAEHRDGSIVGMPVRPAESLTLAPQMLACIEGIVERIIHSGDPSDAPRLIAVVGSAPTQGSSTVALHLAVSLSQLLDEAASDDACDDRVLLLDADLASSHASAMAGLTQSDDSQTSSLRGEPSPSGDGPVTNRLDVLTAGLRRDNRRVMAAQFPQVLRSISNRYRHVVIDLPSITQSETPARLAAMCDAVVLVCKAEEVRRHTVRQTIARLNLVNAKVTVAVLNQRRFPIPDWIYRRT